jgi:hypothetical protein
MWVMDGECLPHRANVALAYPPKSPLCLSLPVAFLARLNGACHRVTHCKVPGVLPGGMCFRRPCQWVAPGSSHVAVHLGGPAKWGVHPGYLQAMGVQPAIQDQNMINSLACSTLGWIHIPEPMEMHNRFLLCYMAHNLAWSNTLDVPCGKGHA